MSTEYGKTIAKNLRRLLYESGKTAAEMSRDLNINKSTISGWMNGARVPRGKYIDVVCDYLGATRSDLVEEPTYNKEEKEYVEIPIYGRVAAGIPTEMIEDIDGTEEIHRDMLKGGKQYFCLTIHGDSMEPKMSEGDVIIVLKTPVADDGDLVVATVNGDDATCKRLKMYKNGLSLVANNPSYPPMFFTAEEVETLPVTILGRVVELRAKF